MSSKSVSSASPACSDDRFGSIEVLVHDVENNADVTNGEVLLFKADIKNRQMFSAKDWFATAHPNIEKECMTDEKGYVRFNNLEPATYIVQFNHVSEADPECVEVVPGCVARVCIDPKFGNGVEFLTQSSDCKLTPCTLAYAPGPAFARIKFCYQTDNEANSPVYVTVDQSWKRVSGKSDLFMKMLQTPGSDELRLTIYSRALERGVIGKQPSTNAVASWAAARASYPLFSTTGPITGIAGNVTASLTRTETELSPDLPLWALIRRSTEAMSYTNYAKFLDRLFCNVDRDQEDATFQRFKSIRCHRALPFTDSDSYRVLKVATEAFVMVNCAVLENCAVPENGAVRENGPHCIPPDEVNYYNRRDLPFASTGEIQAALNQYLEPIDGGKAKTLPYLALIRRKLPDIPIYIGSDSHEADLCFGLLQAKLSCPCLLELIWSYWHEEGMLVQTMNVITQRFQNLRSTSLGTDPLANTEIDALRPLNNLLWGYTQDEQHRLTVLRRNYEYNHHYGVRLEGKAVQNFRPADSRSKFLAAFHHLLRLCTSFFKQDDDTTVKADAFPVLNALKEVHQVLTEGAHNQFGDLPSTARIEMLMQQWILGRPEFREFLPTRLMVAYPEPWMDRVDAMKKLQGWTDTSVMHFRGLAIFGEQLLLSIRYGNWSDIYESSSAFNWARYWRPQIQGYIHAYRAATGVDLSIDAADPRLEATLPSLLLRQRLNQQLRTI